eukprot:4516720-Amphidinium_carterae.1
MATLADLLQRLSYSASPGRTSLTLQARASANRVSRPRLGVLCFTQQARALACRDSRPRLGSLRLTRQAKVATI